MDISLNAETLRLIGERLGRGDFASADDLVRASLSSLDRQRSGGDFEPGEWDDLLAAGEAGGPSLDGEAVFAELRGLRAEPPGKTG